MTEEAKYPYYLRYLWGEKLQKYSEERWTQTGEPCWNDFQKEQIILPEGLPEKILKHLKSGYCAIIGPENTRHGYVMVWDLNLKKKAMFGTLIR
jgi:hypothetical protein